MMVSVDADATDSCGDAALVTVIRFHRQNQPYGEFSNFARFPVVIEGKKWPTTEHYYQAQKFAGTPREEQIRHAPTAMKAARLGRDRSYPIRTGWEEIKLDVMRTALRAKFHQHESLRGLLLDTGDALLVEHSTNDHYWGDGGDGSGKNMLGRLLMELREAMRSQHVE